MSSERYHCSPFLVSCEASIPEMVLRLRGHIDRDEIVINWLFHCICAAAVKAFVKEEQRRERVNSEHPVCHSCNAIF
jgi:hypothetical protein